MKTIPPYPGKASIDHEHVTQIPPLSTYPSTPPVSGPHAPIPPGPLPEGTYDSPPDIARAIHDLEHAAVIVWYSPSAPSDVVNTIKEWEIFDIPYLFDSVDDANRVLQGPVGKKFLDMMLPANMVGPSEREYNQRLADISGTPRGYRRSEGIRADLGVFDQRAIVCDRLA